MTRKALTVLTPGQIIDFRRITGASNAYVANFTATSGTFQTNAGPLQLSYTPPVDCWWEVYVNIGIIQKVDTTAYNYMYLVQNLSPGDALVGLTALQAIAHHHASNVNYVYRAFRALWALAADTAYTCTATWSHSGGTWTYYMGPAHMHMEAKAWAR